MGSHKYPHYFKQCPYDEVDVYRVIDLFGITDPCVQHAIKKLFAAGKRGAKNADKDVQEAIDSLLRYQEMRMEESGLHDKLIDAIKRKQESRELALRSLAEKQVETTHPDIKSDAEVISSGYHDGSYIPEPIPTNQQTLSDVMNFSPD